MMMRIKSYNLILLPFFTHTFVIGPKGVMFSSNVANTHEPGGEKMEIEGRCHVIKVNHFSFMFSNKSTNI